MLRHLLAMIIGSLLLIGTVGYAWPADARPASGTITLDNQRFGVVQLSVDGRELGDIPPESRRDFMVPAGDHSVRVRSRDGQAVLAQTVRVRPHGAVQVLVAAREGQLTVRNATGRSGRLLVDGMDRGGLDAGQVRVLLLDPGAVSVQIRQADRVLDSARLSLRPGERETWAAQAPATAELRLRNPLPVPVDVQVEGRQSIRLAQGETQVLRSVAAGLTQVVVRAPNGRVIATERVNVDPYDGGLFLAPLPSEGAVRLVNLGAARVEVYAGDRRVASIEGRGEQVVFLPLGTVQLTLRERSRNIVLRTAVDVEPFEQVTLRCDMQQHFVTQERALVAELEDLIAALRRLAS